MTNSSSRSTGFGCSRGSIKLYPSRAASHFGPKATASHDSVASQSPLFQKRRKDNDDLHNETARVRSRANQGNVRAADYQPLREQLWRRREAAQSHRREAR